MDGEVRFWERIEGDGRAGADDAQHWVQVYRELIDALRATGAAAEGDPQRIPALIAGMEERLEYWTARLHDAPIAAARGRRRRAERKRDTA